MGIAVVGDSVGAHFELPEYYFNATEWNSSTFSELYTKLTDEFDLPYMGFTVGHE